MHYISLHHSQILNDDGRTTSKREKILTITVKRGWKEGTKVTFQKEGDQGPNKIPGNLKQIAQTRLNLIECVGSA